MAGFQRPKNKTENDELELRGFWLAQALAKDIAESNEKITLEVIWRIHKTFFQYANPDIAGRFRKDGEDIKKLKCIEPPPGRIVMNEMYQFWRDFDTRISSIPKRSPKAKKSHTKWLENVFHFATWVQHKMAAIHPFCEGNGRMARIMTNLVLIRFGLQPSRINYEGEDKKVYLDALCQIDYVSDYKPLKKLISESVYSTYRKILDEHKKQAKLKRIN